MQSGAVATTTVFIPLPFIVLLVLPYQPLALCAVFFLCGIGFSALRVSIRKQLMETQPAHRVGQIGVSCNAYGLPVLAIAVFAYARSWELGPYVPMLVFGAIAVTGVVALFDLDR